MRREFQLPEQDREYLEARGLPWETIVDQGSQWLLIHEYSLPAGFNVKRASVALLISPGYPDAQIDMANLDPHLSLTTGGPIKALSSRPIAGKQWQQWSRHRTGANPWRPGEDSISTHLVLVDHWLHAAVRGA